MHFLWSEVSIVFWIIVRKSDDGCDWVQPRVISFSAICAYIFSRSDTDCAFSSSSATAQAHREPSSERSFGSFGDCLCSDQIGSARKGGDKVATMEGWSTNEFRSLRLTQSAVAGNEAGGRMGGLGGG